MTRYFHASEKKLLKRYNLRLLAATLPTIAAGLTLFAIIFFNRESFQPVSYYYIVSLFLCALTGGAFFMVLIGSLEITRRLSCNRAHTYVEITGKVLIVSKYLQTHSKKTYKKLWIIKLSEIKEVYQYKNTVIVVSPARLIEAPAEWLSYSRTRNGVLFENWWYDNCGGKFTGGVEIPDMFANPYRIAKTIEHVSGKTRRIEAERKKYREEMLAIAKGLR